MPIAALPDDTVRLLGSHNVISTPVSLVKELLENSLDAEATSIEILIAPNTVDRIEVRDNGHGIHPDDYDFLGRAGHTSKITSLEDLRVLGGSTLGFRGQALASANNLGTVTFTTKLEEDKTGTMLKLAPGKGGVEAQQCISASKGTIVSVSGLFSRVPVREQVAIKEAPKTLAKIKHVLQAYALARPHIQLSFRVLGGNAKQSWKYSPPKGASIKEAIIQVFGIELMPQCLTKLICSSAEDESEEEGQEAEKFTIEAVLPKPDADPSKISKGAFFSVDSRPVSTASGTMKKLLACFRLQLSKALGSEDGQRSLRDPFIQVNIKCSPGSYDPNIEPSKDEVLFANESRLTDLFDRLCSEVYANASPPDSFVTFGKRQLIPLPRLRTPPQSSDGVDEIQAKEVGLDDRHFHVGRSTTHTPLNSSSSPCSESQQAQASIPNKEDYLASQNTFKNRGSGSARQPRVLSLDQDAGTSSMPDETGSKETALHSLLSQNTPQKTANPAQAPLPRRLPASPPKNSRGWNVDMSADPDMSSDEEAEHLAARFRAHQESGNHDEEDGAESREGLDPWTIAKMAGSSRSTAETDLEQDRGQWHQGLIADEVVEDLPILQPYGRNSHIGLSTMDHMQIQTDLPGFHHPVMVRDAGGVKNSHGFIETGVPRGRPRRSQRDHDDRPQMHIDDAASRPNPPYKKPRPRKVNGQDGRRKSIAEDPMDIRIGLEDSVDNRRITDYGFGQSRYESPRNMTHSPGPLGDLSPNISQQPAKALPNIRLTRSEKPWLDGDSRKYLMKRQRSEAEHRRRGRQPRKRAKTDQLPLEKVPDNSGVQHLVQTVTPDPKQLEETSGYWAENDVFHADCRAEFNLEGEMTLDDVTEVEAKLRSVLSAWTEKVLGTSVDVELDIRASRKGKAAAAT